MARIDGAAAVMVFAFAGCGTTVHFTPVNAPPHAMRPRLESTVELFTSGPPARPHVDVEFIEAEQTSGNSLDDTPEMMAALRREAAQRGCDGVVIGGTSSRQPGVRDVERWLVGPDARHRKNIYGTCIVYTDAPAMAAGKAPQGPPSMAVACERVPEMNGTFRCPGSLVCRGGLCVSDSR